VSPLVVDAERVGNATRFFNSPHLIEFDHRCWGCGKRNAWLSLEYCNGCQMRRPSANIESVNAYPFDVDKLPIQTVAFVALRDILVGEELLLD
jgi:hypothetical protein